MLIAKKYTELTDQLIHDWAELWKSSPYANITNSPVWTLAANHAFRNNKLAVVTVYDSEKNSLLAVAPFIKKKIFGISVYTSPGLEFSSSPQILADLKNDKIMNYLMNEISKVGNIFIPNISLKLHSHLDKHLRFKSIIHEDLNPYIEYSNIPPDAYEPRGELLYKLKKANGEISIIPVTQNPLDALEHAFSIDTHSAKHNKGKGVFYRKDVREFYIYLVKNAPEYVHVSLLYFKDQPVSYSIGFMVNGIHQGSQKAYLPDYRRYSPGRLLINNLINHYKEAKEFNFGKGNDKFKQDFTQTYRELINVFISKNPLLRFYFTFTHKTNYKFYSLLSSHPAIYKKFKKIKNLILMTFCITQNNYSQISESYNFTIL